MKKLLFLGFMISSLVTTVAAQDFVFNPTLDPTAAIGYAAGEILRADIAKKAGVTRMSGTGKSASAVSFAYNSTPALRQQTVAELVKRLQVNNAAAAKEVINVFGPGKTDYGQQYQAMNKGTGLRDNDAVDALTNYLVTGYQIVNNLTGDHDISAAQNLGARTQIAILMSSNTALTKTTIRARMGEEFKLQTVLLAGGWVGAVKANTQSTYRQNVAAMFKSQYHMDMAQLKLTSQGFAKK